MTRAMHRRLIRLQNNAWLIAGGLITAACAAVLVDRLASVAARFARALL